jgi:PKD repeat protein
LAPGQEGAIDLKLEAKGRRPLVGGTKTRPFEVQVDAASGKRQSQSGLLEVTGLIPTWMVPILGVLLLLCCLGSIAAYAFGNQRFTEQDQRATEIALVALETEEAQAQQEAGDTQATEEAENANIATSTSQALTAIAFGDTDEDGLTNQEEAELGTDPEDSDTDGDGLNDGQEVNEFGTNPQNRDHDGDLLPDGDEVNIHLSSPVNPDTDGDGLNDGQEVNKHGSDPTLRDTDGDGTIDGDEVDAGRDPVSPDAPTVTPNPTDTPSPSPVPPTPTFTPTPLTPPTASLSGPTTAIVDETISFDGSDSRAGSASIGSYNWDMGDGTQANGSRVQHAYDSPGTYNVTLTVVDQNGQRDQTTSQINIAPLVPPTASISGPSTAMEDEQISFNGNSSKAGSAAIASYNWDMGDDKQRSGSSVQHTYSKPGTYNVTLTVRDENGQKSSATAQITIEPVIVYDSIDSAVNHPNGKAYFFLEDEYYRFDFASDEVDRVARIGIGGWIGLLSDLDAAVNHPNGKAYFFKGSKYYRFDFASDRVDKVADIGISGWIGVPTNIDAAVNHPNGKAYFFKGSKYYRFDFASDRVDKVADIGISGWIGLPPNIDAAVNHPNGKAYFFVDDEYFRFDFGSDRVDRVARINVGGWKGLPFNTDS